MKSRTQDGFSLIMCPARTTAVLLTCVSEKGLQRMGLLW